MLSNDRSRSSGFSRRSASRWSEAFSSSTLALGRLLVDPVEEARRWPRRRASCAAFWPAISAGFLIALGRIVGSRSGDDLGAGLVERLEDRRDRALGIDDDGLALELGERAFELGALVQADAVAEMLADVGADLLAGDEQIGGAVGVDQRIGQRDRRVGRRPRRGC